MVSVNDNTENAVESVSQGTESQLTEQTEDLSDVVELMSEREANIWEELKHDLEEKTCIYKQSEREFKEKLKLKESNLKDVKIQMNEAQEHEENLRRDLKRVTKDIEVLEKRDIEIRNTMMTENRQFHIL